MLIEVTKKQLEAIKLLANDAEAQLGFADDEESEKRQESWRKSVKQIDAMLASNHLEQR